MIRQRIMNALQAFFSTPPRAARYGAKPWIVVHRDRYLKWLTNGDRDVLREFLLTTTWRKLQQAYEDEIINCILPEPPGQLLDKEFVGAFVAGKATFLEFLCRFAAWDRLPLGKLPQPQDDGAKAKEEEKDPDEPTPIDFNEDR